MKPTEVLTVIYDKMDHAKIACVAHFSKGMSKTPWAQGGPEVKPGTCGADGEKAQGVPSVGEGPGH